MRENRNKKQVIALIILLLIVGVAFVLQLLIGNVPVALFRFPLNIIIAVVWLLCVTELYRVRKRNVVAQFLLSPVATWISVATLVVVCMVMGLQRQPAVASYPFVVSIFYVITQLLMVILCGWRNASGVRWRFLCNHVGLWLALVAGFWGAADSDIMRTVVVAGMPNDEAYYIDGRKTMLGYTMQLSDFRAEYFDNGTPSSYEADIIVDGSTVTLSVNRPYARTWSEDIYLVGYEPHEQSVACIVQVVSQPWKWPMAAGIVMLIVGAVLMFVQGPQRERVWR